MARAIFIFSRIEDMQKEQAIEMKLKKVLRFSDDSDDFSYSVDTHTSQK